MIKIAGGGLQDSYLDEGKCFCDVVFLKLFGVIKRGHIN